MYDLLQKAVKLGLDAPKCQAPGCYKGRLSDCRECLACHGTGLDAGPARVLMAVVMWNAHGGVDTEINRAMVVLRISSRSSRRTTRLALPWCPHNGTPEGLATAALRVAIEAAS